MAMIMITHDLGVIAETCEQVVVMYAGQVVEQGSVFDIFDRPQHPYTQGPAPIDPESSRTRQSSPWTSSRAWCRACTTYRLAAGLQTAANTEPLNVITQD